MRLFLFVVATLSFLVANDCTAQTLQDLVYRSQASLQDSPAGGLLTNREAAVIVFFRKSKKLVWLEKKDSDTWSMKAAATTPPVVTDDTKENGPTPTGEYLIGKRYKHAKHKIDWYKLYPRKEDKSGYYGYSTPNKTGRLGMGLHPGSVSLGCATVTSKATPKDSDPAWKLVKNYVDKGKLRYKNDDFSGFLIVIDE